MNLWFDLIPRVRKFLWINLFELKFWYRLKIGRNHTDNFNHKPRMMINIVAEILDTEYSVMTPIYVVMKANYHTPLKVNIYNICKINHINDPVYEFKLLK